MYITTQIKKSLLIVKRARVIFLVVMCSVVFFGGIGLSKAAAPDPATAKRNERINYIIHLISDQRYAEAAQSVEQLFIDYPSDAASYEARGILELHVGAIKQASQDFTFARAKADASDALPSYGLALAALFQGDNDTASKMLDCAETIASPAEQNSIQTAKIVLASSQRDYKKAIKLANVVSSPLTDEIVALCQRQDDPDTGAALLERFVAAASTDSIPRITEDCGLRYTGPNGHAGSVIEPSLTEPILQGMFVQRLAYENAPVQAGDDNIVMGAIGVGPTGSISTIAGGQSAVVTIYVDDRLLGMVNSDPYRITWDTRKVDNGIHVIKFEISNLNGVVLATQYKKVKVTNAGGDAVQTSIPVSDADAQGLWSLLDIHPAYKAAQWELYTYYKQHGEKEKANQALLTTAALDSAYHDVYQLIGELFQTSNESKIEVASNQLVKIPTNSHNMFKVGSSNIKEVALTFDDGPSPVVTPVLLDNLKRAGASATFFVVGIRSVAAPDILRRMHAEGHEVDNHTYTHPNLDQAISQHIMEEYLRNGLVIKSLTGKWPRFLRPPGGNTNPQVMQIAQKCGMIGGFWTIDAIGVEDSGSPQKVAAFVSSHIKPGAIVLMHNGTEATANAIPQMTAALKAKGYRCVTLSQLARDSGISLP